MITRDELIENFIFDYEQGRFYRIIDRYGRACYYPTGGTNGKNNVYERITFKGIRYMTHRLVWLLVTGTWPSNYIDHIDGNSLNNLPNNLREATPSQNSANSNARGKLGYKGITEAPLKDGTIRYMARFGNAGQKYLGTFNTIQEAHEAYVREAENSNPGFYKYKRTIPDFSIRKGRKEIKNYRTPEKNVSFIDWKKTENLSIAKIASLIGKSTSQVSYYLSGEQRPKIETIKVIEKISKGLVPENSWI